jgi:hypothetical protein
VNMWTGLNWPREGPIGRFWEHGDESSGVLDQLHNCQLIIEGVLWGYNQSEVRSAFRTEFVT